MKKYLFLSITFSIIIYLIASFIKWDVYWIIYMNKWSDVTRGIFVMLYIIKEMLVVMVWDSYFKEKN